jgi:hypothetical protein
VYSARPASLSTRSTRLLLEPCASYRLHRPDSLPMAAGALVVSAAATAVAGFGAVLVASWPQAARCSAATFAPLMRRAASHRWQDRIRAVRGVKGWSMAETAAPDREGLGSGRGWARFRAQCAPVCVCACFVCCLPCASRSRTSRGVLLRYTPQTPLSVVSMLVRSCYGTVDVFDARGPRVTVFRVRYYVRTRPRVTNKLLYSHYFSLLDPQATLRS